MTLSELTNSLRSSIKLQMPLPGAGQTAVRHARLLDIGRQNLVLARLAEAHWDAIAILAEAGHEAENGAIYGVWASETPGKALSLDAGDAGLTISGTKRFCTGAGIVDRALVTVGDPQQPILVEIDLKKTPEAFDFDQSCWKATAFVETCTATATFRAVPICAAQIIAEPGWYLNRLGFWRGACGPAACWAGGAQGLVDYAMSQSRRDPHTLAHLGAMRASVWGLYSHLARAGREIDEDTDTPRKAKVLALTVRHLVEQLCTEILRRLTRAYGPHPLVFDADISRRYQELDVYLRQSHAERDLEALGRDIATS